MSGAGRRERALRAGAWWAAAVVLAAVAVALFGRAGADSFATTWIGMAAGAERPGAAVVVWDDARGGVVPRSPIPARLAAATGLPGAWSAWTALLVLVWMGGTRRLALSLGAGAGTAAAAGLAAGGLVPAVAAGRSVLLEAAALPWLLGAVLGREGTLRTTIPVLALGLLSPEGIRLALPVLLADALSRSGDRAGRWLPAALGAAALFALPEPEWARFLRFEVPRSFTVGPWAWPERTTAEALERVVGSGVSGGWSAGVAAAGLSLAALAGGARAGARGGAAVLAALGLVGIALGERWVGPAPVLGLVFPAVRLHPLPDVAAVAAGPVMLALAARLPAATLVALGGLVPVLLANASPVDRLPPPPAGIAAAVAAGPERTLALPLTAGNDRRWRRALPAARGLRNGTQEILAANAPLLARELEESEPRRARDLLRRLGITRVVAPPGRAAALGTVEKEEGGEALARLEGEAPAARLQACVAADGWTLRSSVGNPDVSVPERAIDGDAATRWGTGAPQAPGQFFEIEFGRELALERIELRHEGFASDFPRGFRVLVDGAGEAARVALRRDPYLGEAKWRDGFLHEEPDGTVRIPLGRAVRRIRIELTRRSRIHDWSIAGICAVEAQRAGEGSGA